jgi:hypothetical protein
MGEYLDDLVDNPERTEAPINRGPILAVGPRAVNALELELHVAMEMQLRQYAIECGFNSVRFAQENEQTGEQEEVCVRGERFATDAEQAALDAMRDKWEVAISAARALGADGTNEQPRSPAWDDPANQSLIHILNEWNKS